MDAIRIVDALAGLAISKREVCADSTRRAGLPLPGQQFLAAGASLCLVVLPLHDGGARCQVAGLAPFVVVFLRAMGWPVAAACAQPIPTV